MVLVWCSSGALLDGATVAERVSLPGLGLGCPRRSVALSKAAEPNDRERPPATSEDCEDGEDDPDPVDADRRLLVSGPGESRSGYRDEHHDEQAR